jgi:hypothetical protein
MSRNEARSIPCCNLYCQLLLGDNIAWWHLRRGWACLALHDHMTYALLTDLQSSIMQFGCECYIMYSFMILRPSDNRRHRQAKPMSLCCRK